MDNLVITPFEAIELLNKNWGLSVGRDFTLTQELEVAVRRYWPEMDSWTPEDCVANIAHYTTNVITASLLSAHPLSNPHRLYDAVHAAVNARRPVKSRLMRMQKAQAEYHLARFLVQCLKWLFSASELRTRVPAPDQFLLQRLESQCPKTQPKAN